MSHDNEYWFHNPESTQPFIERVADTEAVQQLGKHTLLLAQSMATMYERQLQYYGAYRQVKPDTFFMDIDTRLSIIRGQDSQFFNPAAEVVKDYMPQGLFELSEDEVRQLCLDVPTIPRLGFSRAFCEAFEKDWQVYLKWHGYIEDRPPQSLEEVPQIAVSIATAREAKRLIIDSCEEIVAKLDWSWALGGEAAADDVRSRCRQVLPASLASIQGVPVLGIGRTDEVRAAGYAYLESHETLVLGDNQSLILLTGEISPQDATLVRDMLCVEAIDRVAETFGRYRGMVGRMIIGNPGLGQVMIRISEYFNHL